MEQEPILKIIAIVVFLLLLIFFTIISIILNYHWSRYGIDKKRIKKVKIIYFGISFIFLTIIIFAFLKIIL